MWKVVLVIGGMTSSSELSEWAGTWGIFLKNEKLRVTVLNLFRTVIMESQMLFVSCGDHGISNDQMLLTVYLF